MGSTSRDVQQLTPKGQATRQRILEAAADLIYTHGVHRTNNDLVRKAAGVSGSQLNHYFPDKESLVRAVIAWQADGMCGLHRDPPQGELDSLAALRAWADSFTSRDDLWRGGCTFGSLASEIMKTEPAVRDQVAAGFDQFRDLFQRGLEIMRERGELRPDADPAHLAYCLIAAFQGGMLLIQAARSMTPLRHAVEGALQYVESFA